MIKYLKDRAVVRLTGPITEESVIATIEAIEHACEDCFYEKIEISISSPGGEIYAYERLLEFIDGLRDEGVRIDTGASGVTASAAAFLLSTGDNRRASPGCRLTYHLCRVEGQAHLTAAVAEGAAAALDDLDQRIVTRLAERSVEAAKGASECAVVDDFHPGDWKAIARFLILQSKGRASGVEGKEPLLRSLRETLDGCRSDARSLAEVYRTLFALDCPISPVLAREMFLIDRIGSAGQAVRPASGPTIVVPEWQALWPGGRIETQYLRRHTLFLGETGSGKTASGIMPLVRAMVSPDSDVGCALVIDPKRELLPSIRGLGESVRVIEPSSRGRPRSMLNLTSAPEWGLDSDLAAGRYQEAARRILVRSAGLATQTPARVWAGLSPGHPRNAYWDHQGGSLASLALSIAMAVIERRREIFAGPDTSQSILSAPKTARGALLRFAEAAGIVPTQRELEVAVDRALKEANARTAVAHDAKEASQREAVDRILDDGAAAIRRSVTEKLGNGFGGELSEALETFLDRGRESIRAQLDRAPKESVSRAERCLRSEEWEAVCEAVKRTDAYALAASFRQRFHDLDQTLRGLQEYPELRDAVERIRLCGFSALEDADVRPAPNVMALAQRVLDLFLTPARPGDGDDGSASNSDFDDELAFDFGGSKAPKEEFILPISHLARALKPLFGPECDEIWQDVARWETLARSGDRGEASSHYTSILAIAHQAFRDFAASAPAWTLYFGIEPYWKRIVREEGSSVVDFAGAVDADEGRTIWVVQPRLGGDREVLVAKAMKAAFFEAVLGNEARAAGRPKPLVGYVADEFHRFVTAGEGHGEQGFLDTCRTFGAFCALASQSVASIEHALAGTGGNPEQNAAAVSILLNNVGTKMFFRTTDEGTIRRIRSLCPTKPGRRAVVDVRPPSTLSPGECYAVLPDGRFERRQLAPCYPGESAREGDREPERGPAGSVDESDTRRAEVIRLHEPKAEF